MDWSKVFEKGLVPAYIEGNPNLDPGIQNLLIVGAVILTAIVAYLIGSLNFAIMLSKRKNDDIREHGSKNAGTTNMLRTYGKKMAVITLLGDFLKAFIAVWIGSLICVGLPVFSGMYIAALFCIVGHVFPVYYKFKGGKGIAAAAGAILGCGEPIVLLLLLIIFAIIVIGTKYVSLASIMVSMLYPLILERVRTHPVMKAYPTNFIIALVIGLLVFIKHWENVKRLWNHTERKISFGKKDKNNDKNQADAMKVDATVPKKRSLHHDDDDDEVQS